MKHIYALLFAVTFLAFFSACTKDKHMRRATVINTGDISFEGCGYLLQLENDELLKPNHLPGAFQHGGIEVDILYDHTGLMDTCQYGTVLYDLINLKEIELAQ